MIPHTSAPTAAARSDVRIRTARATEGFGFDDEVSMPPASPRRRHGRLAVAFALTAGGLGAAWAAPANDANASPAEAQALLAGATIDYSQGEHHFYEYYAADGAARGGDGAGGHPLAGRWKVRPDGTVCFLHDDPNQSGCVFVQVSGTRIEFHRIDGVVEGPFTLVPGNPHGL